MPRFQPFALAVSLLAAVPMTGFAADAAAPLAASASVPAAANPASSGREEGNEPNVRRSVIEDDGTRIDELRVRGQLQRVTVAPKGRAPSYEIIVGDGSRDLSESLSPTRGATGKRVWNLLRF